MNRPSSSLRLALGLQFEIARWNLQNLTKHLSSIPQKAKGHVVSGIVALTLAQAYTPAGDGMKDQVDDLMDALEEIFGQRRVQIVREGKGLAPAPKA